MRNSSGKKNRQKEQQPQQSQQHPQQKTGFTEIKPLNYIQSQYLEAIQRSSIIFGIGSAGTGKTFIAATYAAQELYYKNVSKIILTRPNVEVGRGLGFLPGDLTEKFAPYLEPFDGIFNRSLGPGFYQYALRNKVIEPKPLGFLRGATFEDAIVLIDECQNLTRGELHMILSRIGENCKIILSGDPDQADIRDSGLMDATTRLEKISGVEVVKFLDSDIVRSKLCKQIIMAYRN